MKLDQVMHGFATAVNEDISSNNNENEISQWAVEWVPKLFTELVHMRTLLGFPPYDETPEPKPFPAGDTKMPGPPPKIDPRHRHPPDFIARSTCSPEEQAAEPGVK